MSRVGAYVIMDRYTYCQYAAAVMQGLPMSIIRILFSEFPPADLTFFLKIDPAEGRDRVERRARTPIA
jgi:thymidylate kinase